VAPPLNHRSIFNRLVFAAIALAQEAAAAARARAEAAAPSLKKPSAFLAESSDEGDASKPKTVSAPAAAGQATLFSFLSKKASA
jgi:hypothetical protein